MPKLITDEDEKYRRASQLMKLRRKRTNLNQSMAGRFFGLAKSTARKTMAEWESGKTTPQPERSDKFIEYLREILRLSESEMADLWQSLMVEVWGYSSLDRIPPLEILPPTYPFVGRHDKVEEIVSYLQQPVSSGGVAVCVIWGMGGVGKTELARAVASRLQRQFPDGQLLIELRGDQLPDEQMLSTTLALKRIISLFASDKELPASEVELVPLYRSTLARRRMLILVDNALGRAQVEPFFPPAGSVLIVTSREHIELGGQSFLLNTLPPEVAASLLVEIHPRIGNHSRELAELCANLPLALRICASLLKHSPIRLATFITQLRAERLKYLVRPNENAQDPRASVEASLRLSYEALKPPLQDVIQQLSAFPSSFTLEAAQAVVEGVDNVSSALTQLYMRSMVQWYEETDRYSLHDLVWEFCNQRLTDTNAVRLRHARFYASVARNADELYDKSSQSEGLKLFDQERAHIDAAWTWLRSQAVSAEIDTLLIAYAAGTFLTGKLRYTRRDEHLPYLQAALDAARRRKNRLDEGRSLNRLGAIYYLLGELDTMRVLVEQALPIARDPSIADRRLEADLINNLGLAHWKKGEHEPAIALFEERIAIAQEIGDRKGEAAGLCNLGTVYIEGLKRPEQARGFFTEYLRLTRELKDDLHESEALTYLGEAYAALGDEEQAVACWEQSRRIDQYLGNKEGEAVLNFRMGKMLAQHDPQRALPFVEDAYRYASDMGHKDAAAQIKALLDDLKRRTA